MSRFMINASWDDAPHLDEKAKAELKGAYPPYQVDARTKGIPQLGSGAIYPVGETEVLVDPFDIPLYWPRGYALDVGWNRTAALWGALDRETDTVVFYSEHYRGQAEPSIHADAVRARGEWMRGVVDPAARGRGQKDGEQLLRNYTDLGLHLSPAINTVEAGLFECWQRLSTGRIKVFKTLQNWLAEYRIYRRDKKGDIVKENDHLMDAMRYFIMSELPLLTVDPRYLEKMGHKSRVISDYDPYANT